MEPAALMQQLHEDMRLNAQSNDFVKNRKIVTGEGNLNSQLILIGEAPGGEEERLGHPFVGKAGQNLSYFLEILNLKREDIYITNLVKVRPCKINEKTGLIVNRPPDMNEIGFFIKYLFKEVKIINPKLIVTLGNYSLKAILNDANAKIGALHGEPRKIGRFDLFPLYHPASIIYNPPLKTVYEADLLKLKQFINLYSEEA